MDTNCQVKDYYATTYRPRDAKSQVRLCGDVWTSVGKENRKDFSDRLSWGKWVWEQEGTSGERL